MHIKVPSINVYHQHGQVGWGCNPRHLIYKMKSLSDISKAQTLAKTHKHTHTLAHSHTLINTDTPAHTQTHFLQWQERV